MSNFQTPRRVDVTKALMPSTIGFDNMAAAFDKMLNGTFVKDSFPPYDIIKKSDVEWTIRLAVAGYPRDGLDVSLADGVLTVSGSTRSAENSESDDIDDVQYMHKSISTRRFSRRWSVSDNVEVTGATLLDGILTVNLVKIQNEKNKVTIQIG